MDISGGRIDLHVHSLFSDGVLLPSEILRRAADLGYRGIAITDHADASNLETILQGLLRFSQEQGSSFGLDFVPGVELTHVMPQDIARLARRAKALGAALVVVHGETLVEPVAPGTNLAAAECPQVDILAHPGLITLEEAKLARENDIFLEITSRQGHSLSNGHVARVARETGAKLVVNTDTHSPSDMLSQARAAKVAAGAGLSLEEIHEALVANAEELLARALRRLRGGIV